MWMNKLCLVKQQRWREVNCSRWHLWTRWRLMARSIPSHLLHMSFTKNEDMMSVREQNIIFFDYWNELNIDQTYLHHPSSTDYQWRKEKKRSYQTDSVRTKQIKKEIWTWTFMMMMTTTMTKVNILQLDFSIYLVIKHWDGDYLLFLLSVKL